MFKTYVRPCLESNTVIWSPSFVYDIDKIESVQRSFTKYLPGMYELSYIDRLKELDLESLEVRRIQFVLIYLFKAINGQVKSRFDDMFQFNITRTPSEIHLVMDTR